MVRQLIRREVKLDPGQIVGVVREALGILPISARNIRVVLHPEDAGEMGVADGERVRMGNARGELVIHVQLFDGLQRKVVIVESIWPNAAFEEGIGINVLTGADAVAPLGGSAFHDNRVWIRPA